MVKVPKCMSTQHPDNVNSPFFAEDIELSGEDEIQEAYYAFSHLGCDEQMWDCEGKEVDAFVVKKLLGKYEAFFKEKKIGKDLFITLRVPNPTVETTEAKILIETLESIPRSFDASEVFYNGETAPIFEVILPMAASANTIDRIYRYYCDFVVGKQNKPLKEGDITIAEWVGEFNPQRINVIPLFEDKENMLSAHNIVREYLKDKDVEYQRVFLARSDPAMNYGLISAVLLNKIALQRLQRMSKEVGIGIYPILGVGSVPFRGNLRPQTVERVAREYPSVHTFTIQSAFKYDNPPDEVTGAVKKLQERDTGYPQEVDEERCREIIEKYSKEYAEQLKELAEIVNSVARFVPSRRKRKLHIGLYGYARKAGNGIKLPRAIPFAASLYSIGLPPEILGLNALNEEDIKFVRQVYLNFEEDLKDSLKYFNPGTPFLPEALKGKINDFQLDFQPDKAHEDLTKHIIKALSKHDKPENIVDDILRAAHIRRFLG